MPIAVASEHPGHILHGNPARYDRKAIGLCFSGGGYRATLFHAGVVLRLGELGLLPKINRISSVSGGSITSGLLARAWSNLAFDPQTGVADPAVLKARFLKPVLAATARTLDIRVGIEGFLPFQSAGNRLARLYDRYIFGGMRLAELPAHPQFIFNATNLQTGGLFRFTRTYLADWRALIATTRNVRLSEAVAASSAFPPVLAPLRLDLRDEDVSVPDGARFDDPEILKEPVLVDGGVYDNLGLEAVWKRCGVIIASYAGHNAAAEPSSFGFDHMVPVIYTFLAASIDWRERLLVAMFNTRLADGLPERAGTYWTAGTSVTGFPVHDGWKPTAAEFEAAKLTPTRLEALGPDEQRVVIRAGYGYADAGLRSYVLKGAPAPAGPPDLN
jgi:NTE family protein